jgi:uncharacterized GH25 family protein
MSTGIYLGKRATSFIFTLMATLLLLTNVVSADEDISGVVVDANGKPVTLTYIYLANAKNTVYFKQGHASGDGPRRQTNTKGEFTFTPH